MRFRDRTEAGRLLAARLLHLKGEHPLVLALPRGGVPVALPIAEALGAPLDLLLVRKLGAPGQPELALGAVVEGDPPQTVLNEEIVAELGVTAGELARETERQVTEIARRRRLWRPGQEAPPAVRGRTVVVVDDGIATGATARVALEALARAGAARRVLAAPVAPRETTEAFRAGGVCEEAVFLAEPERFGAVGAFYDDFRQVEDGEVAAMLRAAAAAATPRPE
jgi:putative phosphoribosyl transferase